MNKQEAIEQIKNKALHHCGEKECYKDGCEKSIELNTVFEIINQIDESKKVVIPQFVADWIDLYQHQGHTLFDAMDNPTTTSDVGEYLADNLDIFARAWLDGYEVEKEKLYTVEIPNPNRSGKGHAKFRLEKIGNKVVLVKRKSKECYQNKPNQKLTESAIKEDFEWAWQWAKPVEE